MKTIKISLWLVLFSLLTVQNSNAQNKEWHTDRKVSVLFGLTQPLVLNGFNIEAAYVHNRFIFDYSHGMSLDFSDDLLTDDLQSQGVEVHIPFSTGFGVGYLFTRWLNVRVEPKWHRFEFYYQGDEQIASNQIAVDSRNFSLGLGIYGFFQPFRNQQNALKGISVAPSIRFWPTVASSFENNEFRYQNRNTGNTETLETLASGIGFSPLIINLSIGYTLNFR